MHVPLLRCLCKQTAQAIFGSVRVKYTNKHSKIAFFKSILSYLRFMENIQTNLIILARKSQESWLKKNNSSFFFMHKTFLFETIVPVLSLTFHDFLTYMIIVMWHTQEFWVTLFAPFLSAFRLMPFNMLFNLPFQSECSVACVTHKWLCRHVRRCPAQFIIVSIVWNLFKAREIFVIWCQIVWADIFGFN